MKPMQKLSDSPTPETSTPAPSEEGSDSSSKSSVDKNDDESGGLINWVKNLLPAKSHDDESLRDAIEELIEDDGSRPQSAVAAHERHLIANILALRDLPVVDVMVPRADITAIDIDATDDELFELLAQRPHSRIAVYKDDLDNIVGILNMKDLVLQFVRKEPINIQKIMREVLVVSPAMRVLDMLLQMRQSKTHIAFVVDEFGGIDGLVTINDLTSAIVGEVDDEFEFTGTIQFIERPDGSIVADARYEISDFEEIYGNIFSEDEDQEDIDTLGGLVTYLAGHVPSRGEVIRHESGIEFDILDADPRKILRLRLRNLPPKKNDASV